MYPKNIHKMKSTINRKKNKSHNQEKYNGYKEHIIC